MRNLQFLLLEDSELDTELIQATLQDSGFEFDLIWVQSREQFIHQLQTQPVDLILSDYSLPDFDGISALTIARQICPQVPFIFVSATLGEELAIETLKSGATDYVLKQRLGRLVPSIQRALRETQERQDRQRAEIALQEAEDQYRVLFEQSPVGVVLIKCEDQSFLEFNTHVHQQLEYSRAEFAQLTLSQIEARETPEEITAHIQLVLQQGFAQFEAQHRTKSGQLRDVLVTVQTIKIGGKQYLHSIWQDITERKQAEVALQEHSDRLKLLYEATSELLSTDQPIALLDDLFKKLSSRIDLQCYLNFLVKSVDGRSELVLTAYSGISEAEAQTMQRLDLEQTMCGMAIEANHAIVLHQVQESLHPRTALIRALGITAYAGYPLLARGHLLGALSFGSRRRTHFTPEDLDLLQAAANQVAVALERSSLMTSLQQQTEQLIQANRIKDEFLAVLSHELRTPLNPILGWAKLLRSRTYDAATTERALETIERNAKIQTQLIEDLLDVSRILRGKLSLTVAPVNLEEVIEAALETVRLAAEAKGIEIVFTRIPMTGEDAAQQFTQPTHFVVLGDSNRLQQILWNVLSNAVKFTATGGKIKVQLQRIADQIERRDDVGDRDIDEENEAGVDEYNKKHIKYYAEISVIDTGKGIESDFLPYVFDYFRQADGGTTRTFGGLGLGLAIVRHLVELHGGTIEATSAGVGQGSTFVVKIPLLRHDDPAIQSEASGLSSLTSHPLTGVNVLVVDDEKDTLEFVTFLLEEAGATVTPTPSAQTALVALEQIQPDVLISDIGMPNQDGYFLLHQIRLLTAEQGGTIPAIALTAYAREEDAHRALSAGFQKHLAKPIEPAHLITAVMELASKNLAKQSFPT